MAEFSDIVVEILDRQSRRERVDRDAYLRQYPEHAKALRAFWADVDFLDDLFDGPHREFCIWLLGGER